MKVELILAEFYVPSFLKKRELTKLFSLTAAAFGGESPRFRRLSYDGLLSKFAEFAEKESTAAMNAGKDFAVIDERLFSGAFAFGEDLRRRFGLHGIEDAMRAARLIYRFLGINFLGTPRGEVTINKCLFGETFSPRTCRVISALDRGLMAGLSGGGEFTFTRRMTEGAETCMAYLIPRGSPNE